MNRADLWRRRDRWGRDSERARRVQHGRSEYPNKSCCKGVQAPRCVFACARQGGTFSCMDLKPACTATCSAFALPSTACSTSHGSSSSAQVSAPSFPACPSAMSPHMTRSPSIVESRTADRSSPLSDLVHVPAIATIRDFFMARSFRDSGSVWLAACDSRAAKVLQSPRRSVPWSGLCSFRSTSWGGDMSHRWRRILNMHPTQVAELQMRLDPYHDG